VAAAISTPIVLIYQRWTYYVFRKQLPGVPTKTPIEALADATRTPATRNSSPRARSRDIHLTQPATGPLMDDDPWEWPPELDALTAAPGNHQLLLENDRVRVLLTTIPRGATTPVHTHRWPSVEYVLSSSNFVRRDADQNVLLDTRAADAAPHISDVLWSDPFPPHSLENVGDTELRVIMVEIKQRP
jgi:hypothetical protein